MCNVLVLPAVNKFLLLYPLRFGCVIILSWTIIRTFLCDAFLVIAIPELLTKGNTSFLDYPLLAIVPEHGEGNRYCVYTAYILLMLTEAILFVFAVYNLAVGIYLKKAYPIMEYLVCRFLTWMSELNILFVLCLIHGILIGWYLILLMLIILEFYGFAIVYSYYRELVDDWDETKDAPKCSTK